MLGIIIPTKNRSEFIIKQLYYYVKVKCPFTVYIGDSSNTFHMEKLLFVIQRLKGQIKVIHKKYPNVDAATAMKKLVGIVEEKYVAYTGDDDYLVPNSIKKCIAFLEANPEYTTAHGNSVMYTLDGDGAFGSIKSIGPYRLNDSEYETASKRLTEFLSNYWVSEFSVRLTKNHIQACDHRDIIKDSGFAEILTSCVSIIQGKSKKLECLYLLRQIHSLRNQGTGGILEWITNENWQPAFRIFHRRVTEELVKQEKITQEKASEIVKKSFFYFLNQRLVRQFLLKQNTIRKRFRVFNQKLTKIPGYGNFYFKIKGNMPGRQNTYGLGRLLKSSSPYHEDFMPAYQVITTSQNDLSWN